MVLNSEVVNKAFFGTPKYYRQKGRVDRTGIHPEMQIFERRLLARFKKLGIPMFTVYCYRDAKLQNELFEKGRSKARAGESPHNYAMAIDMVHSTLAWDLPDKKCWDLIGHVGHEIAASWGIKVKWGGEFESLYDPAHWELLDWRDQRGDYPDWNDYWRLQSLK